MIDGKKVYLVSKNYDYVEQMSYVLEDPEILLAGARSSLDKSKRIQARAATGK